MAFNLQSLIPSMQIGPDGIPLTEDQIRNRLLIARQLQQQATDTSPNAGGWASVLAKGVMGLSAGIQEGRLEANQKAQAASDAASTGDLLKLYTGQGGTSGTANADGTYTAASPAAGATTAGTTTGATLPTPGAAGEVNATAPAADVSGLTDNKVFNGFMGSVKEGVKNPYALAAIASTGKAESGYAPGNVYRTWNDPSTSGQAGTSGGIMSWRGPRYAALKATGDLSPEGQGKYFLSENQDILPKLEAAKSVEEAQAIMDRKWGFADKSGREAGRRLSFAKGFLPGFQGGSSAAATSDTSGSTPVGNIPIPLDRPATPGYVDPTVSAPNYQPQIVANPPIPTPRPDVAAALLQPAAPVANPPIPMPMPARPVSLTPDNMRSAVSSGAIPVPPSPMPYGGPVAAQDASIARGPRIGAPQQPFDNGRFGPTPSVADVLANGPQPTVTTPKTDRIAPQPLSDQNFDARFGGPVLDTTNPTNNAVPGLAAQPAASTGTITPDMYSGAPNPTAAPAPNVITPNMYSGTPAPQQAGIAPNPPTVDQRDQPAAPAAAAQPDAAAAQAAPAQAAAATPAAAPQASPSAQANATILKAPQMAMKPVPTVDPRVIAALSSPTAGPRTKAVAEAILQQTMTQRQAAIDYNLKVQEKQRELQQRMNLAPQIGISPDMALDDDAWKAAVTENVKTNTSVVDGQIVDNRTGKVVFGAGGSTPETKNYEYYANQEKAAGRVPLPIHEWSMQEKKSGAGTYGPNTDTFGNKADEEAATRMGGYLQTGAAAKTTLGNLQQLADLSTKINTGKSAEVLNALGPYADALGIKMDGLSETQAWQAIVDKMAPSVRPAGAGSSSDTDVRMYLNALPTIGKLPGANEIINQTGQAIANNQMAAADIANRVFSKEITWQEGEKQIRALPNPYDTFKAWKAQQDKASSDSSIVKTDIPGVTIRRK